MRVEPTNHMLYHFAGTPFDSLSPAKQAREREAYAAMLSSAPKPEEG